MKLRARFLLPLLGLLACGGEEAQSSDTRLPPKSQGGASGSGGQGGGGGTAGAAGQGGNGGGIQTGGQAGSASCQDGNPCKDDDGKAGLCAGGTCCQASLACGPLCCGAGQVCSFQQCITPGASCRDASDCGEGAYCETALGSSGSSGQGGGGAGGEAGACAAQPGPAGRCLPLPPLCGAGEGGGGGPLTCLSQCELKPESKPFEVELKYAWGGEVEPPYASDVMMTPIVIQLDDDDCDGKVTARDIPEIVFTTFAGGKYQEAGTVHAISIVGGQFVEKWSVPGVIAAAAELAAGNIDGEPGNEVIACGSDKHTYALRGDGTTLWKSSEEAPCRMPGIADLDQDGFPEVITLTAVLDGRTGAVKHKLASGGGYFAVSDADGDGKLDIVSSSRILKADGTVVADTELPGSWNAIGDLDLDGVPEIIGANPANHAVTVWHHDASAPGKFKIIRAALDINAPFDPNGCGSPPPAGYPGGGPPTVADFNGDGTPDLALAGGLGYVILDGKKVMDPAIPDSQTFLWTQDTQDCSSAATGSSIFDFNGDGKAEV
ncbi:MAG: VCBS repeat-containing protein, partial [Polyangiaceae bacterium]|nr:VCBS repeat-containing protein [Polyangiaceae bacterium]